MKIEKQCCSFDLSVKLNELGITQHSNFYWKQNEIQTVVTERQMLAAMLFDCYGADGILLNDSTKSSTANASLQHICKAKTENQPCKRAAKPTLLPAVVFQLNNRIKHWATGTTPSKKAPPAHPMRTISKMLKTILNFFTYPLPYFKSCVSRLHKNVPIK